MSAVVFLLVCFLSCSVSEDPEKKQPQLIAVHRGDDVTLPCEAPNNVNIAAVVWIRPDLDPEKHVYLKSDRRLQTADQDPSYVNRVQLKDDEMKNGDLSLILKNVNNNDEGTYECSFKEEGGGEQIKLISIVYLKVEDPQKHVITAHTGDDVILPCQAPNNVTIAAVEWVRSDPERHVFLKRGRHLNTADQDPSYVNRVQLKDDEMKNGELSLILKNVTNNDEGRYECRYVEERGGRRKSDDQRKLISIVYLNVTEPPITAQPGDDVTLPCRAPNVIIAAVEWSRSDLKRYVFLKRDGHVETADQDPSYENRVQLKDDEMKNGELSLILKNVNNNDEGRYECRYKGERKVSSVYLIVGDGDPEDGKHSEDGKDKRQHLGVILPVSLIVGLVGFVIYKKLKGRSENNSDRPVDDPDVL